MYIALFSGGIASFIATLKILNKYPNKTLIWFFDTKIEDQDTYRFLNDCQDFYGKKIEIYSDGRNPWQVFRDERFIGNSWKTPCNKILKRKLLEDTIDKLDFNDDLTLVFGISTEEIHRTIKISEGWKKRKINTEFPLLEYSFLDYGKNIDFKKYFGIDPPRLYRMGFNHNNCGGACVKAGKKQWIQLLNNFPKRYLWHEEEENITREYLNKDVSILRDRRGRITKPLTLQKLREDYKNEGKIYR